MTVVWNFPTRIVFGEGTLADIGSETQRLRGRRVLIVTEASSMEAATAAQIGALFNQAKIPFTMFDEVEKTATEEHVLKASELYKEFNADLIVGFGDEAALDVAKIVRLLAIQHEPVSKFEGFHPTDEHLNGLPPMIAVPTVAGPGSEVGFGAAMILLSGQRWSMRTAKFIPDTAIVDAALTVAVEPELTASSGYVALAHMIEAYCAVGDHPMADAIALDGMEYVTAYLERVVQHGDDIKAREGMFKASVMGSVAAQKGLGVCHSLMNALSMNAQVAQGVAAALCLPAVLDFNRGAIPKKIAKMARLLGVRGEDTETLAFECSGAVRALRRKLGLPEGLTELGVQEDAISSIAARAMEDSAHKTNPRACNRDDIVALLRASM